MPAIEKTIDAIVDEARAKIQKLADEYRANVLIPLCKKHKLTFCSGMGTFAFYKKSKTGIYNSVLKNTLVIGGIDDAEHYRMRYLIPIINDLNAEVLSGNDVFGFYVCDIEEKDYFSK